jgi:hypothetical protein
MTVVYFNFMKDVLLQDKISVLRAFVFNERKRQLGKYVCEWEDNIRKGF